MLFFLITIGLWKYHEAALTEFSGFHCMMRHSMRMNREIHGKPQRTPPPFEFRFLDSKGHDTQYYEPGKTYTIRLIGFIHFRGILLQGRLTNENGFLLGSLKAGRFIESKTWETFGIRMQNCHLHGTGWDDSVTHSDDSKKFIAQLDWIADNDIGPVQFMLTIAEEDEIYWERWRPESGFIMPITWKDKHLNVIKEVFTDEKTAIERLVKQQGLDNQKKITLTSKTNKTDRNFTLGQQLLTENKFTVQELNALRRDASEPLRDAAYQPENVLENKLGEGTHQATVLGLLDEFPTPLWESEAVTNADFPEVQITTASWHSREGDGNEIEHVYDGRFSRVALTNLNNEIAVKTKTLRIDNCRENPCQNNGQCRLNSTVKMGFICICKEGWTGPFCQKHDVKYDIWSLKLYSLFYFPVKDRCIGHSCLSGKCDPNLCKRNGTCIEKSNGELGCNCPPGASGRYCEREIDECNFRRCKNGAKCIDGWNDYTCVCQPGWMGKDCDRPCQDIYRSCVQWKNQGQCEQMRHHTRFFDVNCALSCKQCMYVNKTALPTKPLAPILLPLAWMIGIWKAEVNGDFAVFALGSRTRTVDYVTDFNGVSYTEILAITVADVLMFGKPSINFTSIAINKNDPLDQHIHYGFLTVGSNLNGKPSVALITSSNLGQIMIEEGVINSNSVQFTPMYRSALSQTANKLPLELQRTFSKNNKRLMQSLTKKDLDGRNRSISKRYDKIVDIKYL
ncbi:unnamed protein product [Thelazia callipaeda]|uniref:EGF-like domain-containing protein n=1 Tax=Thelazia callipaeda TaxID=103827 RepID=A0A0N5CVG1_THECL|nr:unnamed protein product [Thelazia callipaeda]